MIVTSVLGRPDEQLLCSSMRSHHVDGGQAASRAFEVLHLLPHAYRFLALDYVHPDLGVVEGPSSAQISEFPARKDSWL
jgi:hypothetical protein